MTDGRSYRNSDLDLFQEIFNFFEIKSNWTKAELARDKNGNRISPTSPEAVCWCIAGAMDKFGEPHMQSGIFLRFTKWLLNSNAMQDGLPTFFFGAFDFNDLLSYDDFMLNLNRYIEHLKTLKKPDRFNIRDRGNYD